MNYPPNPLYGKGVYRRRIALNCASDRVDIELEDCNHAFKLQLHHDGAVVTRIHADAIRYPLSVCGNSPAQLTDFVGVSLPNAGGMGLRELSCPKRHCTHLYHMLTLGIAQASRSENARTYDVVIPDFIGHGKADVYLDGCLIHQWELSGMNIVNPDELKGRPLMAGFSRWAGQIFHGDHLEAAHVLQMGIFTAQGRRFDIDAMAGSPVIPTRIPLGACYSYQPERIKKAIRCADSTRDFTDDDDLLKFI